MCIRDRTKREEDCSKTLTQKTFDDFFQFSVEKLLLWTKTIKNDAGTWRTPKRVNMEQNMQWRRQGVNKESATVITCTDFMFQLFDATEQ